MNLNLYNKTFEEIMPFNAGIFFCKEKSVLEFMLNSFNTMSKEYFTWYGDQIALNSLYKSQKFKIKIEFNFLHVQVRKQDFKIRGFIGNGKN